MRDRITCLYVAYEAVPFAKVGGLADVAGALPIALSRIGVDCALMMPRFGQVDPERWGLKKVVLPADWFVGIRWQRHPFTVWEGRLDSGLHVYMLGDERYYGRRGIYADESGRPFDDELDRYVFFTKGVVELMKCRRRAPDVIHLNDFHTAPIAAYVRALYAQEPIFERSAVVYSIHNMAHQGIYSLAALETLGFDPARHTDPHGPFEFHGAMNLMKAGIHYADAVSTVSPTYAREIMTPDGGVGLDAHIRRFQDKVTGILNGIDVRVWNPASDALIPERYDREHLGGKRAAKLELMRRARLPLARAGAPLIGFVGRLVAQKGVDLLFPVADRLLSTDVSLVVLGSGASEYEQALRRLAERYPDRVGASIGFDDELAHLITAGADIFLMPSRYEPCGLNQMYSLAYGTIPVVRRTGGLADTVVEWNAQEGTGTGFLFDQPAADALAGALGRAITAYWQRDQWARLVDNAMSQDFSWERSARRYREMYETALDHRARYIG
jgi:starch synthase